MSGEKRLKTQNLDPSLSREKQVSPNPRTTEPRQREKKARRELMDIETIYATAPIGLCLLDRNFRLVRVNEHFAAINGISVSEHIGHTLADMLPEIAATLEQLNRQVIESGLPILNYEVRGSTRVQPLIERDWLVSYYPLPGKNGQVLGVNVVVQEITERKRAERALQQQEDRLRLMIETIPQQLWTALPDGRVDYVNRRWTETIGVTLEQILEDGWANIVHPEDLPRVRETWSQAIQTGNDYQVEARLRAADGEYRWVLGQAHALRDERGQIVKWYGTNTDITDVKHREAERKQAQQEREKLLQRERAARQEAEATNRIKNEFLAILSHELRTPISLILGWAQLLQTGKLDEQTTQQAIETIERYAKLQTQLIEDLLDVSRILRGKMVLNVCPVDLVPVIKSALETVKLAAQAKEIEIQTILASDLGRVSGDSARLQQIVWNLLSNAVKFTPQGGRVEIRLSSVIEHSSSVEDKSQITKNQGQMTNDKFVQIQVRDTGKGIAPDFLPYVFDYFRQEDATSTRMFGGLGLGLTLVRYLTELHGGTVVAASLGEGQGASFTVRLPLWKPENNNMNTSFERNS